MEKPIYKYFKREIASQPALLAVFLEEKYDNQDCLSLQQKWSLLPNSFENNPFTMIQIELDEFQEIGRVNN